MAHNPYQLRPSPAPTFNNTYMLPLYLNSLRSSLHHFGLPLNYFTDPLTYSISQYNVKFIVLLVHYNCYINTTVCLFSLLFCTAFLGLICSYWGWEFFFLSYNIKILGRKQANLWGFASGYPEEYTKHRNVDVVMKGTTAQHPFYLPSPKTKL